MSFVEQLRKLRDKDTVVNLFDVNNKNKKTLLYEDGCSIGRAEAFENCKKGFKKLCKFDERFKQFEKLYKENTIDLVPHLLQPDEFDKIKKDIRKFLYMVTPYLETEFAIIALEWIIYKYEFHIHSPEDILILCFPYHNDKIFIKFIRLLNQKSKTENQFSWLKDISSEGRPISMLNLSGLCMKNPHVLEMICSWPLKVIGESEDNDESVGKEIFQVFISLGGQIREKVKLLSADKIEKYIGPFIRVIVDSLSTKHRILNAGAFLLLSCFSQSITLNGELLDYAFKKVLKNKCIKLHEAMRAILDICHQQNHKLNPKNEALFQKKMTKLSENERNDIEKVIIDRTSVVADESTCSTNKIELNVEPETVNKPKVKNNKIKEIINSETIDWAGANVETSLIGLLDKYVIDWEKKQANLQCNHSKLRQEVLRMFKSKPNDLKIDYRPDGLISHLCLALMNPDGSEKKLVVRLINKFAEKWPSHDKFAKFSKEISDFDLNHLMYGEISKLILSEMNSLSRLTKYDTASVTVLKMINNNNISILPESLRNIWNLFLDRISQHGCLYRDNLKKSLEQIQEGFKHLDLKFQRELLNKIVGNLSRDTSDLSCCTDYLSLLPLSIDNIQYLLKDGQEDCKETGSKRKSIKKFKNEPCLTATFYSEPVIDKMNVVLSAFCRQSRISVEEQVVLINPIVSILSRIVSHLSRDKINKDGDGDSCLSTDVNIIDLVKNIMLTISAILSAVINSPPNSVNLESVSSKVRMEVFSKCLYLFKSPSLNEINISVIQMIVKLGLDEFNLIHFLSWIGSHLLAREDESSLNIVNSIIKETLPLCIKQKQQNSLDKVQIIQQFVNDCASLPKHRALLLIESVVRSLSDDTKLESNSLWITLIFMAVVHTGQNESLLIPLLMKFSVDEQIFSWKKIILFLSQTVHEPNNRKRKLDRNDFSDSPINKKRKGGVTCFDPEKKSVTALDIQDRLFMSIKENLVNIPKPIDNVHLLLTMIKYCTIHLKENSHNFITASSEIVKDFIGDIFVALKSISRSSIADVSRRNDFCQSLRHIAEVIGSSLNRGSYLSMLVDLMCQDTDDTVRSKCIELLANKLSEMAVSKGNIGHDGEIDEMARSLFPVASEIVINKLNGSNWNSSLLCLSNMIALGLSVDEESKKVCNRVCEYLLKADFAETDSEKIVIVNWFFKHYIVANDKSDELGAIFNHSLSIMTRGISKGQLQNDEIESSLSLAFAIISRVDFESIGWDRFTTLLDKIFELVTIDFVPRKLSKQSWEYKRQIRMKLSRTTETRSLLDACAGFMRRGIEQNNFAFISGAMSLLCCHLGFLSKTDMKLHSDDNQRETALWNLFYQSISLSETLTDARVENVLEISMKTLVQMCKLFEFDEDIMKKLFLWSTKSDLSPFTYLDRNSVVFRTIAHLVSSSTAEKTVEKTVELINTSECVSRASGLLKLLSVEIGDKTRDRKRRKVRSQLICPFSTDQLTTECPKQCAELIKSICSAVTSLLRAENKLGMNLSISDDTINLIVHACQVMLTIDNYLDKDQYRIVAEQYIIPLIIQLAGNSSNDQALLTPMTMALCKHYSELSSTVLLIVLKTFMELKNCLGDVFESCIKDNVVSFFEDCKLHDNPQIAELANEI